MNEYVLKLLSDTLPACLRYRELLEQMELPEVSGDGRLYRHLADKARSLRGWAEAHDALQKAVDEWERNREDAQTAPAEMAQLYRQEDARLAALVEQKALDAAALLSFAQEGGDSPCVMTVRPDGKAGAAFAALVARTYQRYLATEGIPCTLREEDKLLRLDVGDGGYGLLRREAGLHKCAQGGAATVAVMPVLTQTAVTIDPEDVRVDIYRSSGKGGQNVNKVETAVRLTHLPTGTVVSCQDERSQLANKKRAMEHLVERLQATKDKLAKAQYVSERDSQVRDRSNAVRVWDEQKGYLRDTRTKVSVPLREAEKGLIHRLVVAAATQNKL